MLPCVDDSKADGKQIPLASSNSVIQILPKDVVDRIAAGEVVQRPASVVKELLENSLDAGSTDIIVSIEIEQQQLTKITVSDNGCGISRDDMTLLATRHATSKLRSVSNFDTLTSFGFRGEALASVSMVSRLSCTTRTADSPVGHVMHYLDGYPTQVKAKSVARSIGTTIVVADLFYNLPHRQNQRGKDEYRKILTIVQHYAILYAQQGVGIVCQLQTGKKTLTDFNSSTTAKTVRDALKNSSIDNYNDKINDTKQKATKDIIVQVFGSQLLPHLMEFSAELKPSSDDDNKSFNCKGYVSTPSYVSTTRTTDFVLFVNNRLVESHELKHALENVYSEHTKMKPFAFLSFFVPPETVDVNVHPSKQKVTLLYLDEIAQHFCNSLRQTLTEVGRSFASVPSLTQESKIVNPYKRQRLIDPKRENSNNNEQSYTSPPPAKKPTTPASFIRTCHLSQSGSMEPFVIQTFPTPGFSQVTPTPSPMSQLFTTVPTTDRTLTFTHNEECPIYNREVDLNVPGAFVSLTKECTCIPPTVTMETNEETIPVQTPKQVIVRPQKVVPTKCNYTSIQYLRRRIEKKKDRALEVQLRSAVFVGLASRYRSLLQCKEELVMFNHFEAASELFYQIALLRFKGGAAEARVGNVDVAEIIAQAIQVQQTLQITDKLNTYRSNKVSVSATNQSLADQVTLCLFEHADMLHEYFSIIIEKQQDNGVNNDRVLLKALPVLLNGHVPQPHGLPIFLLRLATEVEWSDEQTCFYSICRELGTFYAQLPIHDNEILPYVRHVLFPALSSLLVPSEVLREDHGFTSLTSLKELYRVFER